MDRAAQKELKRRAERRVNLLDQIDALKVDLAELKAEDKADGYNEKAMAAASSRFARGRTGTRTSLHLNWKWTCTARRSGSRRTRRPPTLWRVRAAKSFPAMKTGRTCAIKALNQAAPRRQHQRGTTHEIR